jgi:hypothetical protein
MGSNFDIGSDAISQCGFDKIGQIAIFFNRAITNRVEKIRVNTNGNRDLHDNAPVGLERYMEQIMLFAIHTRRANSAILKKTA